MLRTRAGAVEQEQPRSLHIRQFRQFLQEAALFLESRRENASHELRMPDRHAQRTETASRRLTVTSAPDVGPERFDIGRWRPAACAIDPSLAEIRCDTRMPPGCAGDII